MQWVPVSRQGQELWLRIYKQKGPAKPQTKPLSPGQRQESESEATRKKAEVNLVQTADHGKKGGDGGLGLGWVSEDPLNKVLKSLECGQWPGSSEAQVSCWAARGKEPMFPTPVKSPSASAALLPPGFLRQFPIRGHDGALLPWMLGLLSEHSGPRQPGKPHGKVPEPERLAPEALQGLWLLWSHPWSRTTGRPKTDRLRPAATWG